MARKYMPQQVFDVGAFTIARFAVDSGIEIEELARDAAKRYQGSFVDDGFEKDWGKAVEMLHKAARKSYPTDQLPGLFWHMQFAAIKFWPDGKKRKKRLLSGTIFTGTKVGNPNRVQDCFRNFLVYTSYILLGTIPMPPDDWSLSNR